MTKAQERLKEIDRLLSHDIVRSLEAKDFHKLLGEKKGILLGLESAKESIIKYFDEDCGLIFKLDGGVATSCNSDIASDILKRIERME